MVIKGVKGESESFHLTRSQNTIGVFVYPCLIKQIIKHRTKKPKLLIFKKEKSTIFKTRKEYKMGLKKVENKESLNIKISKKLNERLKRARQKSRETGNQFNVSKTVENFLEKELKKIEKILNIEQDINEEKAQTDFFQKY